MEAPESSETLAPIYQTTDLIYGITLLTLIRVLEINCELKQVRVNSQWYLEKVLDLM